MMGGVVVVGIRERELFHGLCRTISHPDRSIPFVSLAAVVLYLLKGEMNF